MVMARYMGSKIDGGGGKKPKAAKIKVSENTIAKIKDMGMTAAIKKAGTSSNAQFVEGVKRMYGARRLAASKGKASDSRIQKPSSRRDKTPKFGGGGTSRSR
jgi:hypothetical protein